MLFICYLYLIYVLQAPAASKKAFIASGKHVTADKGVGSHMAKGGAAAAKKPKEQTRAEQEQEDREWAGKIPNKPTPQGRNSKSGATATAAATASKKSPTIQPESTTATPMPGSSKQEKSSPAEGIKGSPSLKPRGSRLSPEYQRIDTMLEKAFPFRADTEPNKLSKTRDKEKCIYFACV